MRRTALPAAVAAALLFLAPRAGADPHDENAADRYPSTVASVWFDTLYDLIRSERTAPPPASRIYGVTAVALYEAVAPGSLQTRPLVGQLNGLTSVPQPRNLNDLPRPGHSFPLYCLVKDRYREDLEDWAGRGNFHLRVVKRSDALSLVEAGWE